VPAGDTLLLRASVSELSRQILPQADRPRLPLTERLRRAHQEAKGRAPSPGDEESWENSLPVVLAALLDRGLDLVEVLIEFDLPHTNSAIDVLLAGHHPGTGEPSYVAVELKQVRTARVHPDCAVAVDLGYVTPEGRVRYKTHPVRQVQQYCQYLVRYLAPLRGRPHQLSGVAFLHNAPESAVEALSQLPETDMGRLFTMNSLEAFRGHLAARLDRERPGGEAADIISRAVTLPLPLITDPERHRPVQQSGLALLDEQHVLYDQVERDVRRLLKGRPRSPKKIYIARGGPGSGKSAIAVELQRMLQQYGHSVGLASGSHAYTETLRALFVGRSRSGQVGQLTSAARRLYPYFNSFTEAAPDSLDVLICDEAHRIRTTSTNRRTPKARRENAQPQAAELMAAARIPVFLLDDHQSLRPDEVGTAAYLHALAADLGHQAEVVDLEGVFRAGGSVRYQRWVHRLLGLDGYGPEGWVPDGRVDVLVADSPADMENYLHARHLEGLTARITAGYCWPWNSPVDGTLPQDVSIGDWRRPWNVKEGHQIDHAPISDRWSTDPRGIGQVGCAYTAQTFEYDWSGVIIGADLVWRDNRFVVRRDESMDPELRKKKYSNDVVERCIRNAYHVLLTRGIAGTVVFSTDPDTQEALRRLVPGALNRGPRPAGGGSVPVVPEGSAVPRRYRTAPLF
jgi:uncharacterized protein